MNDLVKIATEQLEAKAKILKWENEKAIDAKVESIKGQLERLSEVQVPLDLLDLYLKQDGKVWVSKVVGVEEGRSFQLFNGGRDIFYPPGSSAQEPEFRLPTGAYRLVLMAIPQQVKTSDSGHFVDDYGIPINPRRDY